MIKKFSLLFFLNLMGLIVSPTFAESNIQGPYVLHFDTSKIPSDVSYFALDYSFHSGAAWGMSTLQPMSQSTLDLSMLIPEATSTLKFYGRLKNGGAIFDRYKEYLHLLPPKHELCNLNNILPGTTHTVTFTFEPAYMSFDPKLHAGYYLLCDIS